MSEDINQLRVIGLNVENVQKIKFADISPDKNTVIVSGKNGAGKSSLCNALKLALGDKAAAKLITRPITEGETRASASVDLGKFKITRTWGKAGKSAVKIEGDGAIYKSPAEMLKKMVGNLAFDPLEFSQMSGKEQVKVLLDLVKLPIDLDELAEQRQDAYDTRTLVNRTVGRLQGQVEGLPPAGLDVPDEELSTVAIMSAYQAASKLVSDNNASRAKLSQANEVGVRLGNEVSRLRDALKQAEAELVTQSNYIKGLRTDIDKLIDPDLLIYQTQIEEAEKTNLLVRNKKDRNKLLEDITKIKAESQTHTDEIIRIDNLKAMTISEANMPIEGLGFNDDGVTYNGIPLSQCATSEALKVGCYVVIGTMKQQSGDQVAVIIIKDGSLLDDDNLKTLEEIAIKEGVQFWLEIVDDTGKRGIYLSNGEVVA